ncbi:hypothetical protein B9Z55_020380 [Caenorhabditis nigoni]|uniref:Uncharacterized protein n=1 Tax=Caenorhabditis nigoni TaxID=1611254 RepID=A0A2G5TMH1_9PELO|nr:hypothetical protein B9Z55_020380 [Caenorhabditis nigoni]
MRKACRKHLKLLPVYKHFPALQDETKFEERKFEELSAKLIEEAERELISKMKIYDEIIAKNMKLLETEQLKVEQVVFVLNVSNNGLFHFQELLETDSDLRKIQEDITETIFSEAEKTEMKRQRLMEEQKKRDEERLAVTFEKENEKLASELEVKKEVDKKKEEVQDDELQYTQDIGKSLLISQRENFLTMELRNRQYSNRVMNDFLERLINLSGNMTRSYARCRVYLQNDAVLGGPAARKARESFEGFLAEVHKTSEELIRMERRLAEVDKREIPPDTVKNIREMRAILFELSKCVSKFCGRLMFGQSLKNETEEAELQTLMDRLSKIEFANFQNMNEDLRNQLRSILPIADQPQPNNAIEN